MYLYILILVSHFGIALTTFTLSPNLHSDLPTNCVSLDEDAANAAAVCEVCEEGYGPSTDGSSCGKYKTVSAFQ